MIVETPIERLERRLGRLLQTGVLASAAFLGVGLIAWMAVGTTAFSSGMLTIGLMILMATPIMRVAVSLVAYVRMQDWFFVATTVAVFLLLAVTVALAWMKASVR